MKNELILFFLILIISSCNSKKSELTSYISDFEKVNDYFFENFEDKENISELILKEKLDEFPFLKNAIQTSELCKIDYYPKKAIIYKFQCSNNSSDNFIFSDDKFYLIKILNGETGILNYEQFIDNAKEPIELRNGWYLIEQNVTYD